MRVHSRTSHPSCNETRGVQLLPLSTNSLWMSSEDVDWLVTHIAEEVNMGSVPPLADPYQELAPNCAAEDVHIRWNFKGGWDAIQLKGTSKGHTTTSKVSTLTEQKWTQANCTLKLGVEFDYATQAQRKLGTWYWLECCMVGAPAASDEP